MIASNTLDQYTLTMGMHMMDTIVTVLCTSGLVYMPFFAAIVQSIVESMSQGEDEGPAGELAVKFLRKRMLSMVPVFMLAFIPFSSSVSINMASPSIPVSACEENIVDSSPGITSTTYGNFTGGNYVPLWWHWVNDMSTTVSNVALANMPCATDMAAIKVNFSEKNLPNVTDQQVGNAWNQQCLQPAASAVSSTSKQYNDSWWVGHDDFVAEYAKSNMSVAVDVATSMGIPSATGQTTGTSSTTTINCLTAYRYLLSKGRAAMSSMNGVDDLNKVIEQTQQSTSVDVEDYVASMLFASVSNPIKKVVMINGRAVTIDGISGNSIGDSDGVLEAIASFSQTFSNIMNAPDAYTYRQGIPMQVSVCVMVLFSVIPLLVLMSGFDIKVTLILSGLYFGLRFTPAIAGLAAWADSIMHLTAGSEIALSSSESVGLRLYESLPKAWFVLLGFVGIGAFNIGFENLGGAGKTGMKAIMALAKMAIKKSL